MMEISSSLRDKIHSFFDNSLVVVEYIEEKIEIPKKGRALSFQIEGNRFNTTKTIFLDGRPIVIESTTLEFR